MPDRSSSHTLDDSELLRYSRHILLPQIGIEGQQRLRDASVLIIGMGGLGSPAALYLAASGIGRLIIADHDHVELSNLGRQIVYRYTDIGQAKAAAAQTALLALNPTIDVVALGRRLTDEELARQILAADVVIDASDNFPTRFAVNAACVRARTPLVSGAAIRLEGQVTVFALDRPDSPCYRCLYADDIDTPAETCTQSGVLSPLVGVIGSLQALEAIKLLIGIGQSLVGRLLLFDAATLEWRTVRLRKDPHCPLCASLRWESSE